jgi:hypothetical protein
MFDASGNPLMRASEWNAVTSLALALAVALVLVVAAILTAFPRRKL